MIRCRLAYVDRREDTEGNFMSGMKEKGRCENCSQGGFVETVEVTKLDSSSPTLRLRLCKRCATVPSAVWRRRYQPVRQAA
jgi:hypothetical protein